MKRILKIVSGFVAVAALSCLLAAPAQARTFVNVNVGFPGFGFSYGGGYRHCASFYPGYCYRAPVYYRPTCGYYAPARYYGGGYFCR